MLDALRFVASAVAKKDFVPELTHFKIKGGRITGYNGVVALSSDIDVDLDVQPNAVQLINAIRACEDVISLHITPAGRLAVRSGGFRAFVQCLEQDGSAFFVDPEGDTIALGDGFLDAIKAVSPVMGIDASRPWSLGIRICGQSVMATNNVMIAEYWHDTHLPVDVVIPSAAVNELLRVDEAPTRAQMNHNSITFWWSDKRWMRTQLLEGSAWPSTHVEKILNQEHREPTSVYPFFFENIRKLKPFLGERQTVYLTSTGASTSLADGDGAKVEMELPIEGTSAYHYQQLILLEEVAQSIDWQGYPGPCMFLGKRLRGAIIGQRL